MTENERRSGWLTLPVGLLLMAAILASGIALLTIAYSTFN